MSKDNSNLCLYCKQPYRKQDFSVCPHCGGDGGGVTPRVWRPSKAQKKGFIKKVKAKEGL